MDSMLQKSECFSFQSVTIVFFFSQTVFTTVEFFSFHWIIRLFLSQFQISTYDRALKELYCICHCALCYVLPKKERSFKCTHKKQNDWNKFTTNIIIFFYVRFYFISNLNFYVRLNIFGWTFFFFGWCDFFVFCYCVFDTKTVFLPYIPPHDVNDIMMDCGERNLLFFFSRSWNFWFLCL